MDRPVVVPFMKPDYDWDAFILSVRELTGESPTRSVDAQGVKVSDETAFLAALDSLKNGRNSVWDAVKRATDSLLHLTIGFLIICDETVAVELVESQLNVSRSRHGDKTILIVSGNIGLWRDFAIKWAKPKVDFNMRFLADCVYLIFQQMKLDDLFSKYKRRPMADETFYLEER